MTRSRVHVRYKEDYAGMEAFMMSEQARKPCIEAGRDIVAMLSVTVRRSTNEDADGHLADSYKVNAEAEPVVVDGNPRVGSEVYSEHPAAAPEEFGGKRQIAKHWLANVAAAWHTPKKGKG